MNLRLHLFSKVAPRPDFDQVSTPNCSGSNSRRFMLICRAPGHRVFGVKWSKETRLHPSTVRGSAARSFVVIATSICSKCQRGNINREKSGCTSHHLQETLLDLVAMCHLKLRLLLQTCLHGSKGLSLSSCHDEGEPWVEIRSDSSFSETKTSHVGFLLHKNTNNRSSLRI